MRTDEDAFVTELIAGLSAYPRYYAHMGPANRRGPQAPDLARPERADAVELRRRIDAGEWIVDLRERRAFARAHVTGTISIEFGDSFSTYLGWAIPWGTPLTLIGESPDQVAEAQLHLTRIGIDHIAGAATGAAGELASDGKISSYPVTDFSGLAAAWDRPGLVVLDVRRPDEWQAGHLAGAVHVPFWEIETRAAEVRPVRSGCIAPAASVPRSARPSSSGPAGRPHRRRLGERRAVRAARRLAVGLTLGPGAHYPRRSPKVAGLWTAGPLSLAVAVRVPWHGSDGKDP